MRNPAEVAAKLALLGHLRGSASLRAAKAIAVELVVGRQAHRADLVTVGTLTHCYEIKSQRDSLSRLAPQIDWYLQVFDQVSVVVAEKHLAAVLAACDPCVGILVIGDQALVEVRPAKPSSRVTPQRLLDLLPVVNIARMLRNNGISSTGANRASLLTLCERLPINVIQEAVREFLKGRFGRHTKEFRRRTAGRNLKGSDLQYLRAWRSETAVAIPEPNSPTSVDWAVYCGLASAFGPVPEDIQELLAA